MLKRIFRYFEVGFVLLSMFFAVFTTYFNFTGNLAKDMAGLTVLMSIYGVLIVYGLTTFFVKKKIWNISSYVAMFILGFFNLGTVILGTSSNINIFGLISFICIAVALIFRALQIIVCKEPECDTPDEDRRIKQLKQWKEVLDNGFITKEEYEEKRITILGIHKEQKK